MVSRHSSLMEALPKQTMCFWNLWAVRWYSKFQSVRHFGKSFLLPPCPEVPENCQNGRSGDGQVEQIGFDRIPTVAFGPARPSSHPQWSSMLHPSSYDFGRNQMQIETIWTGTSKSSNERTDRTGWSVHWCTIQSCLMKTTWGCWSTLANLGLKTPNLYKRLELRKRNTWENTQTHTRCTNNQQRGMVLIYVWICLIYIYITLFSHLICCNILLKPAWSPILHPF